MDSKFNYRVHIKYIREKAINRLKSLTPLLKHEDLLPSTKLLLYKAYVRPVMTYGAPLWLGAAITNKKTLEAVQNRAVRMCADVPRYVSISAIDPIFRIEPLLEHATHLCEGIASKIQNHSNPTLKDILVDRGTGLRRGCYLSTADVLLGLITHDPG